MELALAEMSTLQTTAYTVENRFFKSGRIPLGIDRGGNIVTMRYDNKGSAALGIVALPGTGKSVLLKRIIGHVIKYYKRPSLVLDLQSSDHYLMKYPNSNPNAKLFYKMGEKSFGLSNLECYTPLFADEEAYGFDKRFGFDMSILTQGDFKAMGLGIASINTLMAIYSDQPELVKYPEDFMEYIIDYPTNAREIKGKEEMFDRPMNPQIKNSILTALQPLMDVKAFVSVKDKNYKKTFMPNMRKGECSVINLHQFEEFLPLYSGIIMRQLFLGFRTLHKKKVDYVAPMVVFEEADLALSKDHEGTASQKWMTEILRRGRKYGFFSIWSTQEVDNLHNQIKKHTREFVVSSLTAADLRYFTQIFTPEVMHVVKNLDAQPNSWGAREWAYVYNRGKSVRSFYPFESHTEIVRTGGNR